MGHYLRLVAELATLNPRCLPSHSYNGGSAPTLAYEFHDMGIWTGVEYLRLVMRTEDSAAWKKYFSGKLCLSGRINITNIFQCVGHLVVFAKMEMKTAEGLEVATTGCMATQFFNT